MTNQHNAVALGIDLGGTKILTAVVDDQGKMLSRDYRSTPAQQGQDAVIEAMAQSARAAVEQAGLGMSDLSAAGIGVPGPCNPKTGILHTTPNLPGWRDVPIKDIMADQLDRAVYLVNDANAAGLAEYHFGAGRGARSLIYVTVSTGIGGGIVLDGEIYTGPAGLAAEIGHITIDDKGPLCNCGNLGCWEALASGTALATRARRLAAEGRASAIVALADGDSGKITARHVGQAAEQGDTVAKELLQVTSHYLGTGFASLINIFNPDVMVIGGGMSEMGALLLEPAYAVAQRRAFARAYDAVRFETAQLGGDSGVLGAAVFALRSVAAEK